MNKGNALKPDTKKIGRPSKFTAALADEICERVGNGQSLRFICDDDHMPNRETVRTWLRDNPIFSGQYARAHEDYADEVFEEMLEIADDGRNDFVEKHTQRGTFVALDDEAVSRSRLRVDTRKWILARLAPKKYGDKQVVEHSGAISLSNVLAEIQTNRLPKDDA